MSQGIYLDNSFVTRPSEKSVSKMMPYLSDKWGTPMAPHLFGQQLNHPLKESYQSLYKLMGAPEEAHFLPTGSGADAVERVVHSVYQQVTCPMGKNQMMTAKTDEAPAILATGSLEAMGCVPKMVEVDANGLVTIESIGDALTPRTALVSLSWANGMTGVIQPVHEIAKLLHDRGVRFHIEASHVLGKLYFDWEDVGADYISFSGDLIHVPKGIGGIFVKGEHLPPEFHYLNIPGIVALGQAAEEALEARDLLCMEVARLRDMLEKGIMDQVPDAVIFFQEQQRLPHVSAIGFPGVSNEALLYRLSRRGVYASIGGGNFQQIALLLKATGVEETLAQTALSFSLSRETNEQEIELAIAIIAEEVASLRNLSKEFRS